MARKTTKIALLVVEQYAHAVQRMEEVVTVRETIAEENWTDFTKQCTPEYIDVYLAGMRAIVENVLMKQECYHGFCYIDHKGVCLNSFGYDFVTQHPEYRDWRVKFYTK
jgi:hypothetical protein